MGADGPHLIWEVFLLQTVTNCWCKAHQVGRGPVLEVGD